MDKIWDRKSFEVGGHWLLWLGWKKQMTTQNWQKSNDKKNTLKYYPYIFLVHFIKLFFLEGMQW